MPRLSGRGFGAPWSTIAYQLGHSGARETERIYKHAFLDDKTAVAEMLGVRIGKIFERGERPAQPDRWLSSRVAGG